MRNFIFLEYRTYWEDNSDQNQPFQIAQLLFTLTINLNIGMDLGQTVENIQGNVHVTHRIGSQPPNIHIGWRNQIILTLAIVKVNLISLRFIQLDLHLQHGSSSGWFRPSLKSEWHLSPIYVILKDYKFEASSLFLTTRSNALALRVLSGTCQRVNTLWHDLRPAQTLPFKFFQP